VRKDGTTFPALITTTPSISKKKMTGLRGFVIDITKRKKNEATLRQSEEQFRQLFSSMPSGVAIYEAVDNGEDFVFRGLNAAAEKIEKINKENVLGQRVTQVFPSVKSFGIFEVFQRVWRTGQQEYFPATVYKDEKESGSWRENWIYKLSNGNIIAIYNDITERKKAEQGLQESQSWLDAVFANMNNAVITMDSEGKMINFNDAFIRFYDFKDRSEVPKTIKEFSNLIEVQSLDGKLVPMEEYASVKAIKGESGANEYIIRRKDTIRGWIGRYSFAPVKNAGTKGTTFTITLPSNLKSRPTKKTKSMSVKVRSS
jgi:PAS domain S-box-containing protein